MKALDLFCCCGGAGQGLANAGFEVTGVDITNNHEYPFEFIHSDVFQLEPEFFDKFDLIWASPPCQAYSFATKNIRNQGVLFQFQYPNLIPLTRQLLKDTNKPFIIENVQGSPIRKDIVLCGEMFGLRVIRHRIFEIEGFTVLNPPHEPHRKLEENEVTCGTSYYAQIAGHGGDSYSYTLSDWQKSIGINWINKKEHLTQAVPPKYSEYIARFYKSI